MVVCGALLWVVVSGFTLSINPWIGLAVGVLPFGALLLLKSPAFRLAWYVLGAMAVFQLPDAASSAKLAYLVGTLLIAVSGCWNLRVEAPPHFRLFRSLVIPAVILTIATTIACLVGYAHYDSTLVMRDLIPYVLLLLAPLVGLDIALSFSPSFLHGSIGVFSILASVGFATDWLERRGVSALPVGKFLLSTTIFGGLGLAIALIQVTRSRGIFRLMWLLTLTIIPVMYFITGTRTALALAAIFVGVIGTRRAGRAPLVRLIAILSVAAVIIASALPFLTTLTIADPNFLGARLASAVSTLQNGVGSDQSGQLRLQSYGWALDAWQTNWLFGTGFGHMYPNGLLSLDTPLMVPAKLGILGCIAVALFLAAVAVAIWRSKRLSGPTTAASASRAFFLFLIALTPFLPVTEDKGLPLALALLIATSGSELLRSSRDLAHTPSVPMSRNPSLNHANTIRPGTRTLQASSKTAWEVRDSVSRDS